jgi:uncharacterized membrane protein (DUF373 family)
MDSSINLKKKIKKIPPIIDLVDMVMRGVQIASAIIVVILFIIGVVDLAFLIFELFKSGNISDVESVVGLIDFVLLLFIIVEVYRTISAYIRSKNPKYVLNIVVYAGVIAIVRKIIVYRPSQLSGIEIIYTAIGYAIILLSLATLVYIVDTEENSFR